VDLINNERTRTPVLMEFGHCMVLRCGGLQWAHCTVDDLVACLWLLQRKPIRPMFAESV